MSPQSDHTYAGTNRYDWLAVPVRSVRAPYRGVPGVLVPDWGDRYDQYELGWPARLPLRARKKRSETGHRLESRWPTAQSGPRCPRHRATLARAATEPRFRHCRRLALLARNVGASQGSSGRFWRSRTARSAHARRPAALSIPAAMSAQAGPFAPSPSSQPGTEGGYLGAMGSAYRLPDPFASSPLGTSRAVRWGARSAIAAVRKG